MQQTILYNNLYQKNIPNNGKIPLRIRLQGNSISVTIMMFTTYSNRSIKGLT